MMPQPKQYPVNDGEVALVKDLQENYSLGYVRLYRSLQNKSWYKKSEYVHLWIHLFVKATRKEREDWFGGKPVKLMPGQFITGRKKLSDETGINESKVERILKTFEIEQQIEQQKSNISRLISIRNWHLYQSFEQQIEQQVNNKRTTSEQQVNTIQEVREYREVKNINIPFEQFWELYQKKVDRTKCEKKWKSLTDSERSKIINHVPFYVNSTPVLQYRKNPTTYLNNKCWEDEVFAEKVVNMQERPIRREDFWFEQDYLDALQKQSG